LVGCSEFTYSTEDFYTGKQLSSEELESLKNKVAETTAIPYETNIDGEVIVFWTSGGTVYHYNRDCSSLARSTTIESGTIEDAVAKGKTKPCSRCTVETTAVTE